MSAAGIDGDGQDGVSGEIGSCSFRLADAKAVAFLYRQGSDRSICPWMSLAAIDLWIGKTLFVPPIIKLCQITRQSQFAMSRLFWFAATCDGFYRAETMMQSIIFGVLCVIAMLMAGLRADWPVRSIMPFRMLSLGLLIFDMFDAASDGAWAGIEFWIFVLFAEYAATIRTIPPSAKDRKRSTRSAPQSSGGI